MPNLLDYPRMLYSATEENRYKTVNNAEEEAALGTAYQRRRPVLAEPVPEAEPVIVPEPVAVPVKKSKRKK